MITSLFSSVLKFSIVMFNKQQAITVTVTVPQGDTVVQTIISYAFIFPSIIQYFSTIVKSLENLRWRVLYQWKKYYKYVVDGVVPHNHMPRCRTDNCEESIMIVTTCFWRRIKKKKRVSMICWKVDFFKEMECILLLQTVCVNNKFVWKQM